MARKKKRDATGSHKLLAGASEQRSPAVTGGLLSSEAVRSDNPTEPAANHEKPRFLLATALLILLPCVAYLPLLRADFIWDDDSYVVNNSTLRNLEGLYRMWLEPRAIPQYYPLVHTTYWIEYHLWGLKPTGYHVVNVLLHAAASWLIWRLLRLLNVAGAWWVAAIFAVHPVMVESVAWITERKNVLSLPLALASLMCYCKYSQLGQPNPDPGKSNLRLYWASLLLFGAALLSKTVVCTLPAVILVLRWWKTGVSPWKSLRPLIPFFVLGGGLGLATAWLEKYHVGARGNEWAMTLVERVLLAGRVVWFYASKLVWPEPLIFFYPRWTVTATQAWQFAFPLAALAVIGGLWLARGRLGRGPLAAVLIFVGVLFPALGFFDVYPFRYSFVADHFQYHASIAFVTLVVAAAYKFYAAWQPTLPSSTHRVLKGVACTLIAALALLTFRRTWDYRGLESIYRDTLAKNPAAWGASVNLAKFYLYQGRQQEALEVAQQGVLASPHIADVYNSLGGVVLKLALNQGIQPEQLDQAAEHFRKTIEIEPNYAEAIDNLTNVLVIQEQYEQALPLFQKLTQLEPDNVDAKLGLAHSLVKVGRAPEAAELLPSILERQPEHPQALFLAGLLSSQLGQFDTAIKHFTSALRNRPVYPEASFELGTAMAARQQWSAARDQYLKVIKHQPWHARARNNLGVAYMNLEQTKEAIEQFTQAVSLAPDYTSAVDNLNRARQALDPNPTPTETQPP
ncbi:MAG: tetratricopeptide repeat protein [Pirellulaceae bacterium]|nr:tetratricopeptide repeat protein [Pirellulaceae bacterium]